MKDQEGSVHMSKKIKRREEGYLHGKEVARQVNKYKQATGNGSQIQPSIKRRPETLQRVAWQ